MIRNRNNYIYLSVDHETLQDIEIGSLLNDDDDDKMLKLTWSQGKVLGVVWVNGNFVSDQ